MKWGYKMIQETLNKAWKDIRSHVDTRIDHQNEFNTKDGYLTVFYARTNESVITVEMLNGNVQSIEILERL